MEKEMQSFMDWFRTQKGIDNIVSSTLVKLWKQSDEYKRQQANFISSNQLVIKSLPADDKIAMEAIARYIQTMSGNSATRENKLKKEAFIDGCLWMKSKIEAGNVL